MKKVLDIPNAPRPGGPYSHAVSANGFVFISGQRPTRPETGVIPDSFREQAQQCLENIRNTLHQAGSSLDQVVKVNAYLSDVANFGEFNEVYRQYFSANFPARTTVGCQLRGILVEIDCIALLPS